MQWIIDLSTYLSIVAALAGIWCYQRLTPAVRYIALLACFDGLTEVVAVITDYFLPSNVFIFPISLGGEAILLTLAYRQALVSPALSRALPWALGICLLFILTQAWLKLGTVQYFAAAQVVSNLYILGLATLYFRKLLNDLHTERLDYDPFFWLSAGLIIYALGNMFIALSSDYILTHYSVQTQRLVLDVVRNSFNIELYAAYLVALLLRPAPRPAA